jgi:hypothetical protein
MKIEQKYIYSLTLVFIFFLTACSNPYLDMDAREIQLNEAQSTDGTADTPQLDDDQKTNQTDDLLQQYKMNLVSAYDSIIPDFSNATRYEIDLMIGDPINQISANEKIYYSNIEDKPLDRLYLMLLPNSGGDFLKVSEIKVNTHPVTPSYMANKTAVEIMLPDPVDPGEMLMLELGFSLQVPEKMGGNYGLFIYQDDILALDAFFPIIPVFDREWKVEEPPQNADLVFTDPAFFDVKVDAPKNLVFVSSGVLKTDQDKGDRHLYEFVGGPQRDFYLAASPNFVFKRQAAGEIKVSSYSPSDRSDAGEMVLTATKNTLVLFSEHFGGYPYTEFDLVSTPMLAGGMEYSGAAALGINSYASDAPDGNKGNSGYLEFSAVHETAHQWFFGQVMNDQLNEPWLDEAFAQYLTYFYFKETYGKQAADAIIDNFNDLWSRADKKPVPINKPAGDYSAEEYAAIIYGRGPLFLLELERTIGDEDFIRILGEYVDAYRWNTVNTNDFLAFMDKSCDCDLDAVYSKYGFQ